ncbi:TIGR02285 family protein [Thermodesulfobacteriota bacterium]
MMVKDRGKKDLLHNHKKNINSPSFNGENILKLIKLRLSTTFFLIFITAISLSPSNLFAKDTITWLTFDYPPMQITKGEQKGTGIGDMAIDFLQKRLVEYNHKKIEVNLKRFSYAMKREEKVCAIGIIKTTQREDFMCFSIPALIRPGLSIVIKKDRKKMFGNVEKISLASLIMNKKLILGFDGNRSYTKAIDSILKKHKGQRNVLIREGYDLIASSLKMLLKEHLDYIIEYPSQVMYLSRERKLGDQFHTISLEEAPDYTVSHVVCPKNRWGKQLTKKVNIILKEGRNTNQYRSFIENWIYESKREEFQEVYNNFLNLKE